MNPEIIVTPEALKVINMAAIQEAFWPVDYSFDRASLMPDCILRYTLSMNLPGKVPFMVNCWN